MAQVVQATCPGCKKALRIPTDWVKKALRCKSCGTVIEVKQEPSSPPAASNEAGPPQPFQDLSAHRPTVPEGTGFALVSDGTILRSPLPCLPSTGLRSVLLL